MVVIVELGNEYMKFNYILLYILSNIQNKMFSKIETFFLRIQLTFPPCFFNT